MKSATQALLMSVLIVSLIACKEESQSSSANPAKAHSSVVSLPADLRLVTAPENALSVAAARSSMKDGDPVVIQGVVGGRAEPIAANRAILTLLDAGIPTCDKNPDDGCKTPWDACCEPADTRAKNSITVQVINEEGQPVQTSLSTLEGVKPLARLAVVGTAKVTPDGAMFVSANGIYVSH